MKEGAMPVGGFPGPGQVAGRALGPYKGLWSPALALCVCASLSPSHTHTQPHTTHIHTHIRWR